jgi:hypothetical protein
MKMAILSKENRYIVSLLIFFCFSCNYENKRLNTERNEIIEFCKKRFDYQKIYKSANDSILNFVANNLKEYSALKYNNWQLDSVLCINSQGDKIFGTILIQGVSEHVTNSLRFFYGVNINNKWYFFDGATIYLFSEKYKFPPNTMLPIELIKLLAMKYVYVNYLIRAC